jgi:hypothetical protein
MGRPARASRHQRLAKRIGPLVKDQPTPVELREHWSRGRLQNLRAPTVGGMILPEASASTRKRNSQRLTSSAAEAMLRL